MTKFGFKFMRKSMRFRYGDGRKLISGKKFSIRKDEKPECCYKGFHASPKFHQAENYSGYNDKNHKRRNMTRLCLVKIDGDIDEETDKFSGRNIQLICSVSASPNSSGKDLTKLIKRFRKLPISKRLGLVIPKYFYTYNNLNGSKNDFL